MYSVKIFRVKGRIFKPGYKTGFSKDIRALKPEDAVEKAYMELGGHHRVMRVHLKVDSIEEITWEETNNPIVKALSRE